ncbi:MAG: 50S ribosomal protein L17, partial [Flavobacteriales bacterium]|nr:50S ribosomal protein L17 [Flavobacteriales bacterium]
MRHGKKFNHLGRKAAHRKAMLANMACSLIEYKRIKTTLAKAKALRLYVEPLITKSKNDTTHSRRMVFSYLKQKEVVTELFGDVASKVAERPGGYTRILKLGNRLGDNAQMAFIELVDYNETYTTDKPTKKKTRRRSSSKIIESVAEEITEEVKEESPAEEVKEESPAEEVKEESPAEEVKEESPAEEVKEES